jgi:hypothetical protein
MGAWWDSGFTRSPGVRDASAPYTAQQSGFARTVSQGLRVGEFSERFGDLGRFDGKMGPIRNGLATQGPGNGPASDRNSLRCRWQLVGGRRRAV